MDRGPVIAEIGLHLNRRAVVKFESGE